MHLDYENFLTITQCYNGDYIILYKKDNEYDTLRISMKDLFDEYNKIQQEGIKIV